MCCSLCRSPSTTHTRSETIGNLFINLLILLHKLGCLSFEYLSCCTANQSSVNSLSNLVYIPPVKLRLEIRSSWGFVVSPGGPSLSSLFFTRVCLAFYEVFFTFLSSVLPQSFLFWNKRCLTLRRAPSLFSTVFSVLVTSEEKSQQRGRGGSVVCAQSWSRVRFSSLKKAKTRVNSKQVKLRHLNQRLSAGKFLVMSNSSSVKRKLM